MGQSPSTPAPPPTAPPIPMGHLMPPPTPMDAVNGPGATQGQPVTFIHAAGLPEHRLPPVNRDPNIARISDSDGRIGPSVGPPPSGRMIGPSVTDDVNRYKHDGTQPMRDKATPSHKKDVEWTIRY